MARSAEVDFPVDGREEKIKVYTTRPDTLYGATFMVLSPEHELTLSLATDETRAEVEKYIADAANKSNVDRMAVSDKDKTGVFTGSYCINPLNGEKIPIWTSDYVLSDYGTGAIMCVPAHDDRDFAFAKKFGLPIVQVISQDGKEIENMTEATTAVSGVLINSGDWTGRDCAEMKKEAPHIAAQLSITSCVTGSSQDRDTGESLSRSSTARSAAMSQCRRRISRSCCQMLRAMSLPIPANHRLHIWMSG